jgi:organic hydroperoxide reductase OsmC/OhrA
MGEAHFYAKLVWSGEALGPTRSVDRYSREFRAEFEGKPPLRGSADPAFQGDPTLYNPEDLLLGAVAACHMLSYWRCVLTPASSFTRMRTPLLPR